MWFLRESCLSLGRCALGGGCGVACSVKLILNLILCYCDKPLSSVELVMMVLVDLSISDVADLLYPADFDIFTLQTHREKLIS